MGWRLECDRGRSAWIYVTDDGVEQRLGFDDKLLNDSQHQQSKREEIETADFGEFQRQQNAVR